jgi:hypothetical protein
MKSFGTWGSTALALAALSTPVSATTVVVMVGDDDGFGGTQGPISTPGQPFTNFSSPAILPGTYTGVAGTDATTQSPWTPYTFIFAFSWSTAGLSAIDSAVAQIQTGSVARRTDGSGFGFAKVTASSGGAFVSLGDFWSSSTGATASVLEESVKLHTFDVKSFLTPNSTGTLTIRIDGSTLTAPVDQFAMDFARLTVTQVPESSTAILLSTGALLLLASRGRQRRNDA